MHDIIIQLYHIKDKMDSGEMNSENIDSFEEQYPILKLFDIIALIIIYGTITMIGIVLYYILTR